VKTRKYYSITPATLRKFKSFEVAPVRLRGSSAFEVCEPTDPHLACWSVYGRDKEGLADCISDHATQKEATDEVLAWERAKKDSQSKSLWRTS
jgi:hypothetical protein